MSVRVVGRHRAGIALALAVAACGGAPAAAPEGPRVSLPHAFAVAFRADAVGDPNEAIRQYEEVVRAAAAADADPWQLAALQASLGALATGTMPSLGDAAADVSLAARTPSARAIVQELKRAEREARGPFAEGLVARALGELAERAGDAAEAETERRASGCIREAVVLGPTTWASVTGPDEPGPFGESDAPLRASYPSGDTFGTAARPATVSGEGCNLGLSQQSWRPGVRDVVVDLDVPRAQTIGVVLRAHGAATLRVGGALALRRAFELGGDEAARFARVAVTAGKVRLVARVGLGKDDDTVEIDAFAQDGSPLHASAPATMSQAGVRGSVVAPVDPSPHDAEGLLLAAAAAMASGAAPEAERILWGVATKGAAAPDVALVYARAVESAKDLSAATRAERARSAYERVLEAWPGSWEAMIAHAVLAGVRRGRQEGGIETLRDLQMLRAKSPDAPPILDAFEALVSGREHLDDRAAAALGRVRPALAGSALLADAEDASRQVVGAERVAQACDPRQPVGRDTLVCYDAARSAGDTGRETPEIARLRGLLGAPRRLLSVELREAIVAGDAAAAARAFTAMAPAEQTLASRAAVGGPDDPRSELLRMATTARDAPAALAPLLRATGDDPVGDLDATAERLAAQDRANPILANSATAVLAHTERYDVTAAGLVHWLLFDVRRVSGTTDVEENAQAPVPAVWGRGAAHALRRRILKKDGRVLEPDRTPHASQDHADLSQLEQGDAIEAIYEGFALPSDTGDIGIDTPDLLPDRTAVHDASIELRLPRALKGSLWAHALLGPSTERQDGDARVLTWHLGEHPARRVEDGVPRMDRSVAISFSTAQWTGLARAMRETLAALDEHDPEVAAWARDVARTAKTARETVDALVIAAGKALHEADPGTLSDYGGGISPVQTQTARTFLTSHDGSRSWLVLRSLRELGIPSEAVIAENDPYSADPAFPPHYGRFVHPLVVAHLPAEGGKPAGDLWIDADVEGPALPAGRVSPELRGRLALHVDGSIAALPSFGSGDDERDEVDIRLALDARGDAHGTFAVVLRGRDAQQLAEALVRIVGAERQRALRDEVLAWLPWANVDEVQLASSEGSWQVSLRADVDVSGYAQPEGAKTWLLPGLDTLHFSWPHARVSSLSASFASRGGRESALALANAVQYHVHRRVTLPPGATLARLPGPVDVRQGLLGASRKMTVMPAGPGPGLGPMIEDDFFLDVATGTIAASDYDAFVQAAHAADDGFLSSARIAVP
jgi:hypothetical protein